MLKRHKQECKEKKTANSFISGCDVVVFILLWSLRIINIIERFKLPRAMNSLNQMYNNKLKVKLVFI